MPRYSHPTRLLAAGPLPGHLRVGFCKLADRSHSLPPVQRFFSCSVRRLTCLIHRIAGIRRRVSRKVVIVTYELGA